MEALRCFLAELLGTFALTFVDAGGAMIATMTGKVSDEARAIAPGLLVMAVIYALGNISGAHINPAVTFSFALRGVFPWRRVPLYWFFQLVGATLAALLLRQLFGTVEHVGATLPHVDFRTAFVIEIILSSILITVILGTATRYQVVGPTAALAVGATIILCGLFAKPISGASMNPARSFGPALISGSLGSFWIYLAGPIAGGIIATGLTWLLQGSVKPKEREAAQGNKGK
jgi:MIP family channel proteins